MGKLVLSAIVGVIAGVVLEEPLKRVYAGLRERWGKPVSGSNGNEKDPHVQYVQDGQGQG
jgi:hypothetical protein